MTINFYLTNYNIKTNIGIMEKGDDRILGSGDFVESMLKQADEKIKHQFASEESVNRAVQLIDKMCRENQVNIEALQSGSRISEVSRLRAQLADTLVTGCGLSLAETARQLGVTTSAIANGLRRKKT